MLATCTLTRPAWPRSTHVATTHDVARRNPAVVNPRRTAVAVKAVVGDADGYRVVQRRVVLGAAAACGVAVWMPLTAQADEAVALDTITDRVYLDVAVDNKIIVRPFAIPMEPLLPSSSSVLAAGFLPVETSRASPPHMSREDGLIHPADTSRSNLAAGGKHHSKTPAPVAARCAQAAAAACMQGRVVIGLYGDASPIGAQRFKDLASNLQGVGYRRSAFDKIDEVPLTSTHRSCPRVASGEMSGWEFPHALIGGPHRGTSAARGCGRSRATAPRRCPSLVAMIPLYCSKSSQRPC